ncbi:MAG: transposase [bacterium]
MSIRKVSFASNEYYHIYNRGNSKQKIFNDKSDYERFIRLLYVCNNQENFKIFNIPKGQELFNIERGKTLVSIGAYTLMPNHFHILLTQEDSGDISKFMQKVSTAYVMYFNKKYQRTGGLFEGKFKSQYAGNDRYLKYLFSYIHLNSLKLIYKNWKEDGIYNKKRSLEYLLNYKYSSYIDYIESERVRVQKKILNIETFPKYFPTQESFIKEVFDWLDYNDPS